MAFEDRSALLIAVKSRLNRRDADLDTRLAEHLAKAEADINANLRTRRMVHRWTQTVDDEFVAVPADFGGPISMRVAGGQDIPFRTMDQLAALQGPTATSSTYPLAYGVVGDSFRFYPPPGGSVSVEFTGYRRVPSLVADDATNWMLEDHPQVYEAAVLRHSHRWARHADLIGLADDDFERGMAAIRRTSLAEAHGARLQPTVGAVA